MPWRLLLLALALLLAPAPLAQEASPADAALAEGVAAFRAERHAEALAAFERATAADPTRADAWFYIARIHHETELANRRRALEAIRQARRIEPENVEFMVAELVQLRERAWNNLAELIQEEERRVLARRILALDSTNAYAHEELGALFIRDFWQYRNAISLPGLAFAGGHADSRDQELPPIELQPGIGFMPTQPGEGDDRLLTAVDFGAAGALGGSDRFNVDRMREQGVTVQDLSRRAEAAYARAIGHLESALAYDPRRRPVYDHFARLHTLNGTWGEAAEVLDQMTAFFPDDPATWLYLGMTNHRLGRADAAASAFDRALAALPEEDRSAFESLDLLLSGDDLRRYRQDPDAFARDFWEARNPRYLTPYNERRLEHFSRLVHADLLYAAPDVNRRGWETQRGRVLIRYGPPEVDLLITGDFEQALHAFGPRADDPARRAGITYDMASRSNLFNVWDYGEFRFVFEDPLRNGEFRLYSPPAELFSDRRAGAVERSDYVLIAQQTFRRTPERYLYEAPGRQVDLPYVVTAFKGDGGRADLYVHYGIPLGQADLSGELVDLTVQTGAFLRDASGALVERRRTLYGLRTSQAVRFQEATLWTDTQPLEARPGTHTVSVEFEAAGGAVQGVQRRAVEVPDFHAGRLAVSDLLLAYQVEDTFDAPAAPVASGRVRRGDFEIFPAPWSVFGRSQPIYLYFEPYALATGPDGRSRYTVEVTLRPKDTRGGVARLARRVFGGTDRGVSVEFDAEGDGPDDARYTILDAGDQEPGLYTLTLRVRDQIAGRSVERTRDLFLE